MRILVVDDEDSLRQIAKVALTLSGHQVTVAESANDALDILRNNQYDLLLTDITMPGINGWEFLEKVVEEFGTRMMAIAVMSGYKIEHPPLAYVQVLSKPFTLDELNNFVTAVAHKHNTTLAAERRAALLERLTQALSK